MVQAGSTSGNMTTDQIVETHRRLCDKARGIIEAKNHDYTTGANDPFANFNAAKVVGIEPGLGILLRMLDKIARCRTFVKSTALRVKNESFENAILDIINYAVLLYCMMVGWKKKRSGKRKR